VLGILGLAVLVLLIAITELSTEAGGPPKLELEGVNDAQRIFGGLRQEGDRLGDPEAPVSIQVFNDVHRELGAEQFLATVPPLVDDLVRGGEVQLLYRHYGFGPRAVEQGFIASKAAAAQGYQWQYVYLFFRNQREARRVGGATGDFLESLAASIGDLDVTEWKQRFAEQGGPEGEIAAEIEAQDEVARDLGLRAEPAAIVSGPAGTETLQDTPSLARIEAAIARVD
jgi:protein-disulfide isomerase